MTTSPSKPSRLSRIVGAGLLIVVIALALIPWWRNRGYVRDFFDYGVLIGGVGRLEQGQRPYADFISPIQTGWFAFNGAAEKLAGGTFQGMTWSAAASIVVTIAGLWFVLARRWPWWAAALLAGAFAWGSVSQHTVFWYNPWGVFLMVMAACAAGVAPVLKRETWGWHLVVAGALVLGGINKINIHLLAFGLVLGWAGRAALLGRESWSRVLGTWGCYSLCALVFPVLLEMAWTGVSFSHWWHNVLGQMTGDRAGMLLVALKWETYLKPCHDYYEALRLPQVGLVGVILSVLTVIAIWRHQAKAGGWLDRTLAGLCGLIAIVAGMVLLTTNMDIAYIALAGWIGLLMALWLGFGVAPRGPWFVGALVLPAVVVGAIAWESAWQGQRSQFGYSKAPRSAYRDAGEVGGAFSYFRGTHVTPEMFSAFQAVRSWQESLSDVQRQAVLFGPGSEWMARLWPAPRTPDLPLYILGGWQFGPKELAATYDVVNDSRFNDITVSHVLDYWRPEISRLLRLKFTRRSLGEVFHFYHRAEGGRISDLPVTFSQMAGGTSDARMISLRGRFFDSPFHGGESMFMGASSGEALMELHRGANRINGEVVLRRLDPRSTEVLAADFAIAAVGPDGNHYPRWQKRVELPGDQETTTMRYEIDGSGFPTRYEVQIPAEFAGKVAAGWRGPIITHSHQPTDKEPRWIFYNPDGSRKLDAAEIAAIFPADRKWTPDDVYLRGGQVTSAGLELAPGGELWIRVDGFVTELAGVASATDAPQGAAAPVVRAGWLLGARFELFTQMHLKSPAWSTDFRTWSPEEGGWLVLAVDPVPGFPKVRFRIDRLSK